jgi:hypothetical protein
MQGGRAPSNAWPTREVSVAAAAATTTAAAAVAAGPSVPIQWQAQAGAHAALCCTRPGE